VHDFEEHQKEIYTIKWSPTGVGSPNPNRALVLASASFDAMIKLWDADRGVCLYTLTKHRYLDPESSPQTLSVCAVCVSVLKTNARPSMRPTQRSCVFRVVQSLRRVSRLWFFRSLPAHLVGQGTRPLPPKRVIPPRSLSRASLFSFRWRVFTFSPPPPPSAQDGSLVRTYRGNGGIFEVCWNKDGDKVAACFSNNTVCVIDVRM